MKLTALDITAIILISLFFFSCSSPPQITISPSLDSSSTSQNQEVREIREARLSHDSHLDRLYLFVRYMQGQGVNTVGIVPSTAARGQDYGTLIPLVDLALLKQDLVFMDVMSPGIDVLKVLRQSFSSVILQARGDPITVVPNPNAVGAFKVVYLDGTAKEVRFDDLVASGINGFPLDIIKAYQAFYKFWETVNPQNITSEKQKLLDNMNSARSITLIYMPLEEQNALRDLIEQVRLGRATLEVGLEKYHTKLLFAIPPSEKKEIKLLSLFNLPLLGDGRKSEPRTEGKTHQMEPVEQRFKPQRGDQVEYRINLSTKADFAFPGASASQRRQTFLQITSRIEILDAPNGNPVRARIISSVVNGETDGRNDTDSARRMIDCEFTSELDAAGWIMPQSIVSNRDTLAKQYRYPESFYGQMLALPLTHMPLKIGGKLRIVDAFDNNVLQRYFQNSFPLLNQSSTIPTLSGSHIFKEASDFNGERCLHVQSNMQGHIEDKSFAIRDTKIHLAGSARFSWDQYFSLATGYLMKSDTKLSFRYIDQASKRFRWEGISTAHVTGLKIK